jgi:hypothetical protein
LRKLQRLFCISFLTFCSSLTFGQGWLWAKEGINITNNTTCDPAAITTDNKGNVFETGEFLGSIAFSHDTINGTSIPTAFLVKYDSNGNFLWAWNSKNANGSSVSNALSVATDNLGNSYITGYFIDTVTFGTVKLGTKGMDIFLVKIAPNGNVLWVKSSKESGRNNNEGFSVAIDKDENVYVSGRFSDTISMGSYTAISKSTNVFLVKYDSNGNELWLKSGLLASFRSSGIAYSVTTDGDKNVYMTGAFVDTISFGSIKLNAHSVDGSVFLVRYDSNGNVKWAKSGITANLMLNIYTNLSSSVVTDKAGCIYITGQFLDSITFGSYILYTNTQRDIFFTKYDSSGNVIWAQCGKSLSILGGEGYSLSADKWNNIYLTGGFSDSISIGSLKLVSNSFMSSCIYKFDTSGKALCGTIIDNLNDDANAVATSPGSSNIYFGGDIENGTCIFGSDTLKGGTNEYLFIAKWQPCNNTITSVNSLTEKSTIAIFPNPNRGVFTIQSSVGAGPLAVEVYNVLGKKVLTEALLSPQGNNVINLSDDPSGIYLYRVLNEDGGLLGSGKVIIDK